jgi:hypothetical protein
VFYVLVQEHRSARLDAARLARVRAAFAKARYLDLEGDFGCQQATDFAWVLTSFDDGSHSRAIRHYTGCWRTPGTVALEKLEDDLDAIVNTQRWAGNAEERERRFARSWR